MNEEQSKARKDKIDNITDAVFIIAAFLTILVGSHYACESLSNKGLVCDMAGFLLLFGFGLPSRFQTTWDASPKTPIATTLTWVGVALVITGFILQFLGNMKT